MSVQDILERAAQDGYLASSEWGQVLGRILDRLDQNVYEFELPPSIAGQRPGSSPTPAKLSADAVPLNEKPSDQPSLSSAATKPNQPDATPDNLETNKAKLPPFLQSNYDTVIRNMRTHFGSQPPHTIQRLAELVLRPKRYHRFLPAYINALDRVVSVSSGNDAFPLPVIDTPAPSGPLVNGTTPSSNVNSAIADHGVGGALLTPIPWLRDEDELTVSSTYRRRSSATSSDGVDSNAMADESITADEPNTDGEAVTQGELLRREQEESGPHAVAPLPNRHTSTTGNGSEDDVDTEHSVDEHDQPHARGPEVIGPEDTGPQEHSLGAGQTLDMEAAVGRSHHSANKTEETNQHSSGHGNGSASGAKDGDGDTVIADVDGISEEEQNAHHTSGENLEPDAADAATR